MAKHFLTQVANDVLEATERVADRMEEGLTLLFNSGKLPEKNDAEPAAAHDDGSEYVPLGDEYEDQAHLEEELRNNPLQGIADSVVGDIMSGQLATSSINNIFSQISLYISLDDTQMAPETPLEHFQAFRSAITWEEPFILGLIAFQAAMFFLCIYVSRPERGLAPRLAVMVTIAVIVKSSEKVNQFAAQNWESICTQNYFDARGVFMMVMVCCPLLLDSLIMLFLFIREASQLLVKVKTAQLKQKMKQRSKEDAGGGSKRRKMKEQ